VPLELLEISNLLRAMREISPDEVYNLGAQSFVAASFEMPIFTADVTALGALRILEAIREVAPQARFYQASSSEMFGQAQEMPQRESTPFHPRSPYAVSKVFAHWATVNYRESYDLFACSGIMFNHESPLRGLEFVTRKITRAAARIKLGRQDTLYLGNLDAKRDWGFAGDYVPAMWMMLQQDRPDDFVIATGQSRSVRDFVAAAFSRLDLDWEQYVQVDPQFFRPAEVNALIGDATRARETLGWQPTVPFEELVGMMVDHDLNREGAE
jgi:GDPmannose 4,6-dehydratase